MYFVTTEINGSGKLNVYELLGITMTGKLSILLRFLVSEM